ncbi:hypothetical protein DEJ50_14320 [Streptomyces venezuelae]|uniref:Uncharacterized protein n=1 Tax=Streptomyces venezuelae TaxID=54571 RepID=A0A5P2D6C7_STRVZ|nr:hypothetical protein [Streptomyces venezuelae]QES48821.1 hypothetical protein DEJ50_14320 [Streptomyces venezuelae]
MTETKDSATSKAQLPSFEDAEGLGPQDTEFLRDLVAVLAKHGNLDRFGLCLLHDHFPLGADEVLVETNDPTTRTLHAHVEKTGRTKHAKASQWRFLRHAEHGEHTPGAGPKGDPYQVIMVCDPIEDLCPGRERTR